MAETLEEMVAYLFRREKAREAAEANRLNSQLRQMDPYPAQRTNEYRLYVSFGDHQQQSAPVRAGEPRARGEQGVQMRWTE